MRPFSFLLIFLTTLVCACSSEDAPEPASNSTDIEGTYRLTFYQQTATRLDELDGEWVAQFLDVVSSATNIEMTITFATDGTFRVEKGYDASGGSGGGIGPIPPEFIETGEWKIVGDRLLVSSDGFLNDPLSLRSLAAFDGYPYADYDFFELSILGITRTLHEKR